MREIVQEFNAAFRVQAQMLICLQEATEAYMVQFFEESQLCAIHAKRVTVMDKDMRLVKRLRGERS